MAGGLTGIERTRGQEDVQVKVAVTEKRFERWTRRMEETEELGKQDPMGGQRNRAVGVI